MFWFFYILLLEEMEWKWMNGTWLRFFIISFEFSIQPHPTTPNRGSSSIERVMVDTLSLMLMLIFRHNLLSSYFVRYSCMQMYIWEECIVWVKEYSSYGKRNLYISCSNNNIAAGGFLCSKNLQSNFYNCK